MPHHEAWLDRCRLYTQCWTGSGPIRGVLVLVHGHGSHSNSFKTLVRAILPWGYAIFGFDLRGHGRSSGRRGHIERWAKFRNDLTTVLQEAEREFPGLPLILYGHSMGGTIALDYGLQHPEELAGIIAVAPALGAISIPSWKFAIARVLSRVWPSFTLDTGIDDGAATRDPAINVAHLNDPLRHTAGSARLATELLATIAALWQNANRWRLPLLLLHGSGDRVTSPADSRAFFKQIPFPDKTWREYPGAYHELHADLNEREVANDIVNWLNQHLENAHAPLPKPGTAQTPLSAPGL